MPFSETEITTSLLSYFESAHWTSFVKELERGEEVRHAHIYVDSCLAPQGVGKIIEAYFAAAGRPLIRNIRYLPITPETLNIYNVTPQGMCHFEMFLHYNPEVILSPMPDEFSREGQQSSFWDDAHMENFYKDYDFQPITTQAEQKIKDYFYGPDFRYAYLMMTDDNRGLLHTHAVVETSIHPEQLIPYAVKSLEEMHAEVQKTVSVVFNCYKKDTPKMIFLLGKPEICVEVEWHYNPHVVIKAADPRLYRFIDEQMMREYSAAYPRIPVPAKSVTQVISKF